MHQEKLNPVQLAEAFPEECKKFLPKRRKEIAEALKPFEDLNGKVNAIILNAEARKFWSDVIKQVYVPRELAQELADIDLTLRLISGKTNGGVSTMQIEQAKRTPIEQIYTFERKKNTARGFVASCPLGVHSDTTPSFNVRDNKFMCFGCGERGDVIDFVSKMFNKSFVESVKWLSQS